MNGDRGRIRFARFEPAVHFRHSIVTPKQRPLSLLARDFVEQWGQHVRGIIAKTAGEGPPFVG